MMFKKLFIQFLFTPMVRIKIRMISTAKLSRQLFQMDYFLFFPETLLLVFVSSSTSLLVSPNGFLNDALVYLNLLY